MSDNTTLELPFSYRSNPHQSQAATLHGDWLARHHELVSPTGESAYLRWSVSELAAITYPDCGPEELALAADMFGFYFLFDDQFDGPLGRRPRQVARICDRLIDIVHNVEAEADSPVERAFADLWRRSREGRPADWLSRAAYNWEWYFASHPAEAAGRISGQPPERASYLILRRGTAAMETLFDMVERLGGFDVPRAAFHHPVLRQLRQVAADIPSLSNDIRSYPLEAPRGDVYNLVMIAQRERSCSPETACEGVLMEARLMVDQFADLRDRLPTVYRELGLDPADSAATQRYADGIADWLAGYLHWEAWTGRYQLLS